MPRICAACIGDTYLRAAIESRADEGTCDYCGNHGPTTTIDDLADKVDAAFASHYRQTAPEPSELDDAASRHGIWEWEREGRPVVAVISEAARIDVAPATAIRMILEERHSNLERMEIDHEHPFHVESYYDERDTDDSDYRGMWHDFEHRLQTDARFFYIEAKNRLDSLLDKLERFSTLEQTQLIVEAGPKTGIPALFRARSFESDSSLREALKRPDLHLGTPPSSKARAKRMNAEGIAVFYGATEPGVAMSEIRPPVGSRVLIGRFALLRSIRLLDVGALDSIYHRGSDFDPETIERQKKAKFLRTLNERLTRAVLPAFETAEYLVTQVIAEYLADRSDLNLDGVLYRSAQVDKDRANVMLFRRASRVNSLNIPAGTNIHAGFRTSTSDGWEIDYHVWEKTPPTVPTNSESVTADGSGARQVTTRQDPRKITLEVDTDNLSVHHVQQVNYCARQYEVRRVRLSSDEQSDY